MNDRNTTEDGDPGGDDAFDALLRRAARLPPARAPIPTTLASGFELCAGRFRVLRELGSGGMGVVYEALDRRRGGPVAIKTLTRLDPRDIYRLKGEFRSLSEVVHPNLVRLHHLYADEGRWLFSMELVDGVPFDAWVRPDGALDLGRLRHALAQLVTGVLAIHAAGTLHRDLKPSNMLITAQGRLVILDFGLAADPEPGGIGQTVRDGFTAGTPAYMAPEQAAGREATTASDWYAVGVMLHEALVGRLPFDGSVDEILAAKQARDPTADPALARVDGELAALCLQLLARDPGARPDGRALAKRFAATPRAARSLPPPAAPESPALLGRDHELALLRAAYARSEAGSPVVARVCGESGMGKTALVSTFLQTLRDGGRAVVLSGRCYERESLPYKAVDRLVDELSRYLRQLAPLDAMALMPRAIFALARIFPALARLECVQGAPTQSLDDDQELRRLAFDAFAELLARIRDRRPLVLHIDDLHWTDRDSALLLARIFHAERACPLMLIVSHRKDSAAGNPVLDGLLESLRGEPGVAWHDCELSPLPPETVVALARALLGNAEGKGPADGPGADEAGDLDEEALAREAAGNPLFVDELVRHMRLTQVGRRAGAPLRLQDAIDGRLSELGATARTLLDVLAVAGRPLPIEVLRAASSGAHDDATHSVLDGLRATHLIALDARQSVTCYHDRIRTLVLERLTDDDSAAIHGRLALAWGGHGGADPEVLFEHYLGARNGREAGRYAVRAAAEANHSLAFDRAAALYRHALALLPAGTAQELELHEKLAECLSLAGRWAEAGDAFVEASSHARRPELARHLEHQAALHLLGSGRREAGMPLLRRALAGAGLRWPRTALGAVIGALARLLWLRLWAGAAVMRTPTTTVGADAAPGAHLHRMQLVGHAPQAMAGEIQLAAAALVPVYDLGRGLYYMTAFAIEGLRHGDRTTLSLAAAMSANLIAAVPTGRALSRRLAARASELARTEVPADVASAALGFAGFAALLDGELVKARALGAEGSSRLQGVGRAHAYQAWAARSVECFALTLMGQLGEAAQLFAATEDEARELGDRLAMLAGSSVIRHLVRDDVGAAQRLLAEKDELLTTIGERGVVHSIVGIERVAVALYCGRGSEMIGRVPSLPAAGLAPFDTAALEASCALQALAAGARDPRLRRTVARAHRRLARAGGESGRAMVCQLDAALMCIDGATDAAAQALERARTHYRFADMSLHAALMGWHLGRLARSLANEPDGALATRALADADAEIRQLGARNVKGWALLLAPGFTALD